MDEAGRGSAEASEATERERSGSAADAPDVRRSSEADGETAREVAELRRRDREIRTHEQAHAGVGGPLAGAPRFEYERGPDGRTYAVSGEVSIQIREGETPEETARNAERARRAALAPADPSDQDRKVAAEAARVAARARAEIARASADAEAAGPRSEARPAEDAEDADRSQPPRAADEAGAEPAREREPRPGELRPDEALRRLTRRATDAYARALGARGAGNVPAGSSSLSLLA